MKLVRYLTRPCGKRSGEFMVCSHVLSVAMTAPRNVAEMVQPRPLDADAQATLADVLKRHVSSLDKTCRRPPPLITLTRSLKGEEVVTKAVLGQNLELLLDVCNAFPHSAPSKPSLETTSGRLSRLAPVGRGGWRQTEVGQGRISQTCYVLPVCLGN